MKFARVRTGAIIAVDMGLSEWTDNGEIFLITKEPTRKTGSVYETRYELKRQGYGLKYPNEFSMYGNGSILVKPEDMIFVTDEEIQVIERLKGHSVLWQEVNNVSSGSKMG